MTYKDKFVAVVKSNGKNLREHGDVVTLPFGSEYSIYLKNLETRPAVVKITIDDVDVLKGNRIIIKPNEDLELEGFLEGIDVKNKFKFIQKTQQIADYRGDNAMDGIIRIEYWFEKPATTWIYTQYSPWGVTTGSYYQTSYTYDSQDPMFTDRFSSSTTGSVRTSGGTTTAATPITPTSTITSSYNVNMDEGITVPGSDSDQIFTTSAVGELEDTSHAIVLKLRGQTSSGILTQKIVSTREKLKCQTCGSTSRSSAKFCHNCGTALN